MQGLNIYMDYFEMAPSLWQSLPLCICLAEQDFASTLLFHLPPTQRGKPETLCSSRVVQITFSQPRCFQNQLDFSCSIKYVQCNGRYAPIIILLMGYSRAVGTIFCFWGHLAQGGSCTSLGKVVGQCTDTVLGNWSNNDDMHAGGSKTDLCSFCLETNFISLRNSIVWIQLATSGIQLSHKSLFPASTYIFIFHLNDDKITNVSGSEQCSPYFHVYFIFH